MTAKPMIDMRKLHSELNALAAQQKPCPFCGSDVLRIWFGSLEGGPWSVCCFGGCAVEGPECDTKEEACAAWDAAPRKADIDGRNAVIAELAEALERLRSVEQYLNDALEAEISARELLTHQLNDNDALIAELVVALETIRFEAEGPQDSYDRNGATWTSPSGHEYEDMAAFLDKVNVIAEIARAALAAAKGE
jgi:hypothetical protein